MSAEEITLEQVQFAEGIHKRLTDPIEGLPIGYNQKSLELFNTTFGVPESLSLEEFESIEQLGQRQMLFTRAIAGFAGLIENRDDVPFWLKRLVNYGLEEGDIQDSNSEAVGLLRQLNKKAIGNGAYSAFGRLDMIEGKDSILNENGVVEKFDVVKVAEVQTAMGGMGTVAAIQEAMNGEGSKNSVIEAFKEVFADEAAGEGILAFHVGKGLESYTGEFIALAKLWKKHTGRDATLVIDDSGYTPEQKVQFKQQINEQGIVVHWTSEADPTDYNEITALYRISDTARLTSKPSVPLLERLLALDPRKIQPPIIPALDRTQLMQALLRSGEQVWKGMDKLWEEAFSSAVRGTPFELETIIEQVRSDFPEIEIVRNSALMSDPRIQEYKRDKRYIRLVIDPTLEATSAGKAQHRGTSRSHYDESISNAISAFGRLPEINNHTDAKVIREILAGIRLVASIIDMRKDEITVITNAREVKKFDDVRRRRNPFMYWPVGAPVAKVFALVSYMKRAGSGGQGGWKVTGAPGEDGAITPHTY